MELHLRACQSCKTHNKNPNSLHTFFPEKSARIEKCYNQISNLLRLDITPLVYEKNKELTRILLETTS